MSNRESLRNWGAVLVLLLLASSAALWPTITAQSGGLSTQVGSEAQTIEFNLPAAVYDGGPIVLTSLQALGILFGVVVALVVPAGVVLAFLYVFLANRVTAVTESEEYRANLGTLLEKEKAHIERLSAGSSAASTPEHKMPRWSVLSTSAIILLFATLFGMLINSTFIPEGEYLMGGQLVNSAWPVVGGLAAITLLTLIWRMRAASLDHLNETDNQPIPWDFLWVLVSGLLVVGLGLALMVYLNVPA